MNMHAHLCSTCDAYSDCDDNSCPVGLGSAYTARGRVAVSILQRLCPRCESPIAEVDALPNPERGPLSFATIDRVVSRATRAALDAVARDPEDGPREFAEHVEPLYARSSAARDPDAWARHGAVAGAKAGWSGEAASSMPMLPPDCPMGAAARCFLGAWSFAAGVVMQIRMEVG